MEGKGEKWEEKKREENQPVKIERKRTGREEGEGKKK